jgi:hypothetical protein
MAVILSHDEPLTDVGQSALYELPVTVPTDVTTVPFEMIFLTVAVVLGEVRTLTEHFAVHFVVAASVVPARPGRTTRAARTAAAKGSHERWARRIEDPSRFVWAHSGGGDPRRLSPDTGCVLAPVAAARASER